mgnify:CR=1 FL=1
MYLHLQNKLNNYLIQGSAADIIKTCIIKIDIIAEFPPISKKQNAFGYDVILYNPYTDKEEKGNILDLVKMNDPEKYIL